MHHFFKILKQDGKYVFYTEHTVGISFVGYMKYPCFIK